VDGQRTRWGNGVDRTSGTPKWGNFPKPNIRLNTRLGRGPAAVPELVAEVENILKEIKKWQGGNLHNLLVHNID
jgi:hypothetical protein